jgi:hypothetical protein
MTRARGIAVAGAFAVAVTGAHALYRSWPVTQGTEICVPAALFRQPVEVGVVMVRLPIARIELDVPHTTPAVTETFEPARRLGEWWITGGDRSANGRARRGRPLYLQLESGEPAMPGGPAVMRPSTISDTVVTGAVNLEGIVTRVREDGYVWLDFPVGWIGVPPAIESSARPLFVPGQQRNADTGPPPPAADPDVYAVLRVLPSGRAALTGVIVKGVRY